MTDKRGEMKISVAVCFEPFFLALLSRTGVNRRRSFKSIECSLCLRLALALSFLFQSLIVGIENRDGIPSAKSASFQPPSHPARRLAAFYSSVAQVVTPSGSIETRNFRFSVEAARRIARTDE